MCPTGSTKRTVEEPFALFLPPRVRTTRRAVTNSI
jgi:hypothetical protein